VIQLEVGWVGVGVDTFVGVMCGVGTGVSMRLGIAGMGIEVGVGRWRLWLSESLASELDDVE